MIFISYWELNPDLDPSTIADAAQKLIEAKLYPLANSKQLAWYVSPDYWGITISETDDENALLTDANMWRMAMPGIFKKIKTSVAQDSNKVIPLMLKLKRKISK